MRPHSKVAAQKLYGRIDQSIEAGQQVLISVTNRYNTYEYSGAKTGEGAGVTSVRAQPEGAAVGGEPGSDQQALAHVIGHAPQHSCLLCCLVGSQWPAEAGPRLRSPAHLPPAGLLPGPAVILTTNSWVGGKNVFLGALYLATGGVCLLVALFFFAGYDLGGTLPLPWLDFLLRRGSPVPATA